MGGMGQYGMEVVRPLFCVLAVLLSLGAVSEGSAVTSVPLPAEDGLLCNYSAQANATICANCTGFAGKTPTWFEGSCPFHVPENTTFCIHQLYPGSTASHEGEGVAHEVEHVSPPYNIVIIFGSFGMGAFVRYIFKDTSVPYTVVLFLIGMAWGGLGKGLESELKEYVELGGMNPHLIFHIFLPVLIFESAFAMHISIFRKVVGQCLVLAVPGLLLASFLTALATKASLTVVVDYGWTWEACLLLGTMLSATDPVAVVALLKELGASPTISTLIEGESLFNDGTAIVVFNVLRSAVLVGNCVFHYEPCCGEFATAEQDAGHGGAGEAHALSFDMQSCLLRQDIACTIPDSFTQIIMTFLYTSLGGPLVGLVVGGIAVFSIQRVFNDALIEVTITIVSAYVTFFVAEGLLGMSGVLGVVACGLVFSFHHHSISPEVEHTMHHFWEIVVYLTNTMIFILAGMIVSLKAFQDLTLKDVMFLMVLYVAINVARVVVLIIFIPIFNIVFEYKISLGEAVLIAWGGLRGAVGLALALVIQADTAVVFDTVRQKFIFHVAGIVVLTLCVNGTTTKKVVEYFRLNQTPKRNKVMMRDRWAALCYENRQIIEDLRADALFYDTNWNVLGQLTDLAHETLPTDKHIDPYNRKGAELQLADADIRLEAKYVYLNAVQGSVHKQYAQGILEADCARDLLGIVDKLRDQPQDSVSDNPESWLQHEMLRKFYKLSYLKDPAEANGGWRQRYLIRTWRHAFNVTLGFRESHDLLSERAPSLLPPKESGRILTHCKRVVYQATQDAEEAICLRPDISCSIKTKHAARFVLNHMKHALLARFEKEGCLDADDRIALSEVVEGRMKNLRNFPPTLSPCTAEEALTDTYWFREAPSAAKDELLTALRLGSINELTVGRSERIERFGDADTNKKELTGVYLVVAGVVEIRVGLHAFAFSSGYTIGLQQLLTPGGMAGRRFSDAWTQSECRLLYLPSQLLAQLCHDHPTLQDALWHICGMHSSEILMLMEKKFRTPAFDRRRIAKMCHRGATEMVLDPEIYSETATRKIKIPEFCTVCMLRGRCWEYEMEKGGDGDTDSAEDGDGDPMGDRSQTLRSNLNLSSSDGGAAGRGGAGGPEPEEEETEKINSLQFPCVIPSTFKFATFTSNAIIYITPDEAKPGDEARKHWGRLRAKVKAINLWVGLMGPLKQRDALAVALGREPRPQPTSPGSRHSRPSSGPLRGSMSFNMLPQMHPQAGRAAQQQHSHKPSSHRTAAPPPSLKALDSPAAHAVSKPQGGPNLLSTPLSPLADAFPSGVDRVDSLFDPVRLGAAGGGGGGGGGGVPPQNPLAGGGGVGSGAFQLVESLKAENKLLQSTLRRQQQQQQQMLLPLASGSPLGGAVSSPAWLSPKTSTAGFAQRMNSNPGGFYQPPDPASLAFASVASPLGVQRTSSNTTFSGLTQAQAQPPSPPRPAGGGGGSGATPFASGLTTEAVVGEIRQLDALRQDGLLTEAEFASAKAKLLGLEGGGGGGGGPKAAPPASSSSSSRAGSPVYGVGGFSGSLLQPSPASPLPLLATPSLSQERPSIEQLKAKYLGTGRGRLLEEETATLL